MTFRLILINKNPEVQPLVIGEVLWRMMGKALMSIFKKDVMEAAGPSQLCTKHEADCEAAVQSIVKPFKEEVEAGRVLQVVSTNVFNKINREVMF